ncbi:uncharacterized protein LOC142351778 isoform X2 [Convolutriloba macropyga]|uniref:uncharacterized protein LOC142351778 isoform X2 n=1 Tax=Convolutriloba macropyga TaxID=536237 RepID=UPI003F51E38D
MQQGGSVIQFKCNLCNRETTELFHCDNCPVDDGQSASSGGFLCQICIAIHLARDHTIRNQKGQEPLICSEHKMIQQEYCRSCDVTFCLMCTGMHSKHEFEPLEKRASELKGEVFEMLNELELNEKPLRVKKEQILRIIENHQQQLKDLRTHFESGIEQLRQKGLKVIEENGKLMTDELSKVSETVDEVVEMQQTLRDLFSESSGNLLKKFVETKESVIKCKKLGNEIVTAIDFGINSCDEILLGEKLQSFSVSLCGELESMVFEKEYFICSDSYSYLYKVIHGNGKLTCVEMSIGIDELVSYADKKSVALKADISRCFPVHHDENKLRILLLSTDKTVYIFSPFKETISLMKVDYPPYKNFLWPYTIGDWNHWEPEWCYWDEETKLIKFTHDEQFTVKCDEFPSVRMGSYDWQRIALITTDLSVILVNVEIKEFCVVSFPDVSNISSVSIFDSNLFVWCAEDESVYSSYLHDGHYTKPVKHEWIKQSLLTPVRVNEIQYSLLPCLRSESGNIDTYLFMVKP